ncbi:hypothetical protein BC628DRAFT_476832 [Trametes gibbosa]|nr:hypothetical protein BC628DRAFT_476832 [Trametes gibbosa]
MFGTRTVRGMRISIRKRSLVFFGSEWVSHSVRCKASVEAYYEVSSRNEVPQRESEPRACLDVYSVAETSGNIRRSEEQRDTGICEGSNAEKRYAMCPPLPLYTKCGIEAWSRTHTQRTLIIVESSSRQLLVHGNIELHEMIATRCSYCEQRHKKMCI